MERFKAMWGPYFVMTVSCVALLMSSAAPAHADKVKKAIGLGLGIVAIGVITNQAQKSKVRTPRKSRRRVRTRNRRSTRSARSQVARSEVRQVQQKLINAGYNPGAADGVMGKKTVNAIRNYQSDLNVPVTGVLTADQRAALMAGSVPISQQSASNNTRQGNYRSQQSQRFIPNTSTTPQRLSGNGLLSNSSNVPQRSVSTPSVNSAAATGAATSSLTPSVLGRVELGARQIERMISGRTFSGQEKSSGIPMRFFFSKDKTFVAEIGEANNTDAVSGKWFTEQEAEQLCMRTKDGKGGKMCWSLFHGSQLEMVHTRGSDSLLKSAAGSIVFTAADRGNKIVAMVTAQ